MDRYYNILGVPNNSSREVIKRAYHEKIKTIHPDRVHGTPLEATAAFFTAEINEAYKILMSQFNNINSSYDQDKLERYLEKDIFVENKGLLRYTLSNSLDVILNAIIKRTGCLIPDKVNEIPWLINTNLSNNVKNAMNEYNMNYSMTTFKFGSLIIIGINKKSGNNWYFSGYEIDMENQDNKKESYNNTQSKASYFKNKIGIIAKLILAILVFSIVFHQCNKTQESTRNNSQIVNTRTAAVYATVRSCDWLNVRRTPSSVNNSNIIEAIRVNTKVEILERSNNGWVRIRYNNGKTGYVHRNYLSQ